jgi:hypothetical protein
MILSRRATPSVVMLTISMRALLSPADEFLFSFAFFPSGTGGANDKVVGRMDGDHTLSQRAPVLKFV